MKVQNVWGGVDDRGVLSGKGEFETAVGQKRRVKDVVYVASKSQL